MGIRFSCPKCNLGLNVKANLAGKRAVCPQCRARVRIPSESQIEPVGSASSGSAVPASSAPVLAASASSGSSKDSSETNGVPSVTSSDLLPRNNDRPARAAANSKATETGNQPQAIRSGKPPVLPERAATHAAVAVELPTQASSSEIQPPGQLESAPTEQVSPPESATGYEGANDLLDELPDAKWYVHTREGAQFGPASGELMKQWLAENRIAQRSLVWREGWDAWRAAGEVFQAGSPRKESAVFQLEPTGENGDAGMESLAQQKRLAYYRRRKRKAVLGILLLMAGAFLIVALVVILIVVLNYEKLF